MDRAVNSAWKQSRTRISEPAWTQTIGFGCDVDAGVGVISWHSRMQEVTASGTSEAEYVALSEVVREVLFLSQVQEFMEPSMRVGAVNVFEDNEGAIKLATNKHARRRTKHIDVKHHLVRDAPDAQKVRVAYVKSEDQHTDLLNKPLDMQTFYKHAKFILKVV